MKKENKKERAERKLNEAIRSYGFEHPKTLKAAKRLDKIASSR